MKEIELLIEVLSPVDDALEALSVFGESTTKITLDTYYADPLREDLQPDNTGKLRRSFRVRTRESANTMAYKIDHFNDIEWQYSDEYEIEVSDASTLSLILNNLGLKELVRVDCKKHVFNNDEYEIVLEEVKDLGLFIEIEKREQVTDEQVAQTKDEMRSFLKKLPISFGREMNLGKPEMILRKLRQYSG